MRYPKTCKARSEMNAIVPVNGSDREFTSSRFVLWFGACGSTRLMVWANHLDDAFDVAVDWIVEHAPGLLCDDQVAEEYDRGIAAGLSEEQAIEQAEVDTSCGGNAGNYVASWEWGILAEDPDVTRGPGR